MPDQLMTNNSTPRASDIEILNSSNGTTHGSAPQAVNGNGHQTNGSSSHNTNQNAALNGHLADALNGIATIEPPVELAPRAQALLEKLQNRTATVGVLGMGYVGLPLIMAFANNGFRTVGFDTNTRTVEALQRGESHIGDVPAEQVLSMRQQERFQASTDFSFLKDCDIAIICVPTPLTEMREPDLNAVKGATRAIKDSLHEGQLIILESTTYPGTTDEIVRPILEETGLKAGEDFFLAFSPERIDPGNEAFPIHKVPKVVGGHTPSCGLLAVELYAAVVERPVPVSSTQAAELTKLLENIFRCVNIALVNEMAMLCDRMDIDIWEVIDAAATKPYGFTKFLPGPGLGGHCIPIDPFYLSWKARQYHFQTNFIELAGEVNTEMPRYVIEKIMRALNDEGKAVKTSKIGLLGMSYKANVGDCRESPSLMVAELLSELGAELRFYDPYVNSVKLYHDTAREKGLQGHTLEQVLECDCVVLLTNHRDYEYQSIAENTRVIIDTRNAFKGITGPARIVKL